MKKSWTFLLAALCACLLFAGCGAKPAAPAGSAPAPQTAGESPAPSGAAAESEPSAPVYGDRVRDGTYEIEISSSSSMFRIIDARLTVKDGAMSAVMTLGGDGYEKLYMGTGEEAAAADSGAYIYFVEDEAGRYTYAVPVEALDRDTDCAAFSTRKQRWYDRVLVFRSASLPEGAVALG